MMALKSGQFKLIQALSYIVLSSLSFLYLSYFSESLLDYNVEHVFGFTRIIVPDAILYAELVDLDNPVLSAISSGVKNSLGPSLIWAIANKNWYVVLVINLALVGFIVIYFKKVCSAIGLSASLTQIGTIVIVLSPFALYYSIGALKELPMMLFLLMIVYGYVRRKWRILLLACLALILFRYQMAIALGLVFGFMRFRENSFKVAVIALLFAGFFYPAISSLGILSPDATSYYREIYGVQGSFGGLVEFARDHLYGISIFAIIFRVFQTLFEPIILVLGRMSFYENGSFSVFDFMQFITALFYVFFSFRIITKVSLILRRVGYAPLNQQFIYVLLVTCLTLVCGFSFIHHRYSVPFFPLMYIAAVMTVRSKRISA